MNNYSNQFNQTNSQQMPQPSYGYGQNGRNAPYHAPLLMKKPADKEKTVNIVMTALGGAVSFFALLNLIHYISLYSDYNYYKLSFFATPLLFLLLGASLIFLSVDKLIDPKKQGDKPDVHMAIYISAIALAGIAAVFGLMGLFDSLRNLIDGFEFDGEQLLSLLSYFASPVYSLAGCGAVLLYFIPKLMKVIRLKKSMQLQRQPMPQQYAPYQQFGQQLFGQQQFSQPPKDNDTQH